MSQQHECEVSGEPFRGFRVLGLGLKVNNHSSADSNSENRINSEP